MFLRQFVGSAFIRLVVAAKTVLISIWQSDWAAGRRPDRGESFSDGDGSEATLQNTSGASQRKQRRRIQLNKLTELETDLKTEKQPKYSTSVDALRSQTDLKWAERLFLSGVRHHWFPINLVSWETEGWLSITFWPVLLLLLLFVTLRKQKWLGRRHISSTDNITMRLNMSAV